MHVLYASNGNTEHSDITCLHSVLYHSAARTGICKDHGSTACHL